jgi:hypothetical protein
MTWQQFKQKMAASWVVAFIKRRMMIEVGVGPKDDFALEISGTPADPASVVPPVASPVAPAFNSDLGDTMIDFQDVQRRRLWRFVSVFSTKDRLAQSSLWREL